MASPPAPTDPSRTPVLAAVPELQHDGDGQAIAVGGRVGRYVVLRRIGEGGMGIVYEAHDPELDREVALKLLWPSRRTPDRLAWLRREAMAMARLSHPNVVQVYDVGEQSGQVWIAMELVPGGSLSQWLRTRPSRPAIVDAFVQAARGLQAAHEAGLVHRDVKPSNILLDAGGRVRVGDFGLARLSAQGEPTPPEMRPPDRMTPIPDASDARARVGTPAYMAPEQHLGGTVGPASDQYAFAVALWEALFGARPFPQEGAIEIVLAKLDHSPVEPRNARVPARLKNACLRALAPEPSARYPSMAALADDLQPRARRRLPWIVVGTAAVTAVGIAALWPAAQTCDAADRELVGVWDDDARTSVQRAVLGTELPYAEATWTTASSALDEYAARWTEARAETCRALAASSATEADALDQRSACLHQRRAALEAVVDVVRTPDATTIQRWVAAVGELPPVHTCLAADGAVVDVRVPDEPAMRPRVAALRDRLAHATALGHAGSVRAGLDEVEPALADAQRLGFAPLVAEAWLARGELLRGEGDPWEAERALEQAYWSALAVGDDAISLRAATGLVHAVGYDQARHEPGTNWARHAHAVLERSDGSPAADAALAMAEGSMLRRAAHFDAARERFERAVALWGELGPDDIRHARALASLAGLEVAVERPREALVAYQRALAIELAALGPEHPALASTWSGIGTASLTLARHEEARAALERAVVLREHALGDDHPMLANSLNNLGIVLNRLGEYEAARTAHVRALAIRERAFDPDHPDIQESLNNIAVLLLEQNRLAEAEPYLVRNIASNEHRLGTEHPNLVGPLDNLGIVLREQGRFAEAEPLHRRALAIATRGFGDESTPAASARFGLGVALLGLDRVGEAIVELVRAEPILCGPEKSASRCGEVRFALARARFEAGGDRRDVLALVRSAIAEFERAGPSAKTGLAQSREWLATHLPGQARSSGNGP
jgi:tetratricopeptide (TPR) repeat protein